ncbi:MAG: alanine racemase [Hyphomonadaceae bacterium]|nr:alanine racemase [Hyphomonadaceae bacterium]
MGARLARLTVNPDAIAANWRWFARAAGKADCAGVVKADAYGLGADAAAAALLSAGCRSFFVATAVEGARVRDVVGAAPNIYVLNGAAPDEVRLLQQEELMPVLNSLAQIALWGDAGPAALHIDTGMNRLGISPDDVVEAGLLLPKPKLVMSHLACASTRGHEMNARQRAAFVTASHAFPGAKLSLAASAGAQLGEDYLFDMIRPGIGLYGWAGMDDGNPPLAAATTITAPVLQMRDVPAGESFGYGATKRADKPMRAATVALGYADGFLRSFTGSGYGVSGGARLPLLGRVSMDLVILDATAAPDLKAGDEVEFLGEGAPIEEVARAAGTLPYEILTTFAGTVRKNQA